MVSRSLLCIVQKKNEGWVGLLRFYFSNVFVWGEEGGGGVCVCGGGAGVLHMTVHLSFRKSFISGNAPPKPA